jgi:hypothetical protein
MVVRTFGCPACQSGNVIWLEGTSRISRVDYYRCSNCGHVWVIAKGEPNAAPHDVTVPPRTNAD